MPFEVITKYAFGFVFFGLGEGPMIDLKPIQKVWSIHGIIGIGCGLLCRECWFLWLAFALFAIRGTN